MMKRFLILLLIALPVFAQHDYLTDAEVDKVRDAQEPIERIRLYLSFARQRLDQLQSAMNKNRPGRSGDIRHLLGDYTSIVEAIDSVSDDALQRKLDISLAHSVIVDGEKKFLEQLDKIQASSPADLDMYGFDLKEAIATTSDSMDLAQVDENARGKEIRARAAAADKEVRQINEAEQKPGEVPITPDAPKPVRKPPTLYRPGEKPPDDDSK